MGENKGLSAEEVYGALSDQIEFVDHKLDDAMVKIWSPGGSYTFENLPAPSAQTFRFAYEVTDDFTTDARFVEGAGIDYPAGTTVGVVNRGTDADPVYMYDVSTGAVLVDPAPTQGSTNAVSSGGTYDALAEKIGLSNTPGLVMNDGTIDQTQYEKSGVAETLVKDTVGWSGINKFAASFTQINTQYIACNEFVVPAEEYVFKFKNISSSAIAFWASDSSDITDTAIHIVDAGQTANVTYTVGSGGKVKFEMRYNPSAEGITPSSISEVALYLSNDVPASYEPYHATVDTVKADKVSSATSGHLAGLDANGNLTDSGVSPTEEVTVEGNPVTFESPFEQDAKSVVVSVKPIQDLHGYDHPWVGGAKGNLMDDEYSDSYSNVIHVNAGTYYYQGFVTGDSGINTRLEVSKNGTDWTTISNTPYSDTDIDVTGWSGGWGSTGIGTATIVITSDFYFRAWKVNGVLTNRRLSFGATEFTEFYPYSNECPISGTHEVEIGVSDGESEPTTTTIPLPSTLYDADVDVTEGSADSRKGFVVFDGSEDEGWNVFDNGNRVGSYFLASTIDRPLSSMDLIGIVCDKFSEVSSEATYVGNLGISVDTNGRILVADGTHAMTKESWVAYLAEHPLQVCYELATPTTLSLTPTDVELLEGTNVVSTNGEKVAVTYGRSLWQDIDDLKTDTEGKLDKSDVADVEGDTASKAYSVNDFMLRADGLYKVTQPIAQNASITSSNTTKTTVGEVLTALLNA